MEVGSGAKRILHLTTSTLAFIIFAYFTTNITAEMTSITALANPIYSFDDVLLKKDIQVIIPT